MRKVIDYLSSTKRMIISFILGLVVATSISYGIDSIQSSSVSYTKDGKTMSVKQAIDDLIVKLNEKGGLNITLTEKNEAVGYNKNTTSLKEELDVVLNNFINVNTSYMDITELTNLKNDTYTWTSEDESIIKIDGGEVTFIKGGKTNVVGTGKNKGLQVKIPINVAAGKVLADEVSVGDYVAYDAGTWTETKAMPTSQGEFGGYIKGQNKANSVACNGSTTLKGWRVYSINTSTKTVTIIHAGQPECYYHGGNGNCNASITNLNNRATSEYLNSDYAQSAHSMNKGEADQNNILLYTNSWYWLATAGSSDHLWDVFSSGLNYTAGINRSFGIRPVVVLKPNILTAGKGTDMVGQVAWTLVKP